MDATIIVELIKIVPSILGILVIAISILVFHNPVARVIIPRISGIKAFGIEATFSKEVLDKAIDQQSPGVSHIERSQVLKRANRVAVTLAGSQILWVDDNPEWNLNMRKVFRSLGIFVDLARSTEEALSMLQQTQYDAVISDMNRGGDEKAGLRLAEEMRSRGLNQKIIFYFANIDESRGTPAFSFGMTNRPDHLLHYVIDIMERERG